MHAATSTEHDRHDEPVWVGMEIPSCAEGCGTTVGRAGDSCHGCSSPAYVEERPRVRDLVGDLVDAGIPVSREAVAA